MNINVKKCQVFCLPEQLLFLQWVQNATVVNCLVPQYFQGSSSSAYVHTDIQEVQALIFCKISLIDLWSWETLNKCYSNPPGIKGDNFAMVHIF